MKRAQEVRSERSLHRKYRNTGPYKETVGAMTREPMKYDGPDGLVIEIEWMLRFRGINSKRSWLPSSDSGWILFVADSDSRSSYGSPLLITASINQALVLLDRLFCCHQHHLIHGPIWSIQIDQLVGLVTTSCVAVCTTVRFTFTRVAHHIILSTVRDGCNTWNFFNLGVAILMHAGIIRV